MQPIFPAGAIVTPAANALSQIVQHAVDALGVPMKELAHDDASRSTVSRVYGGDAEGVSLNGGIGIARRLPIESQVVLAAVWLPALEVAPRIEHAVKSDSRPMGVRVVDACVRIGHEYQDSLESVTSAFADGTLSVAEKTAQLHHLEKVVEAAQRAIEIVSNAPVSKQAHVPKLAAN